jgi:DNA polymerase-3 subunit delta'
LRSQLAEKKLKHGYLLITPDRNAGSDIFTLFSLMLFCEKPMNGACFECAECRKLLSFNHSGIRVYNAKFASADVDDLIGDIYIKPLDGDYKLYFINNADAMLPAVQNKLLKSLEEPPEYVIFFLAANNEDAVLKTIASRCEKLYETYFDCETAVRILKEEFPDDEFVEKAVLCADGFVDNARNIIADAQYRKLFYECVEIMNSVKRSGDIIKYLFCPAFEKEHFKITLNILETIVSASVRGIEARDDSLVFVKDTSVNVLNKYIFLIVSARKKTAFNVSCVSVAENLLMSMLEVKYLCR